MAPWYMRSPSPGQAKTTSSAQAPKIINTRFIPARVTTGISAFFRACLPTTDNSVNPFTRHSLMYSLFRTCSKDDSVKRVYPALKYQPREKAGIRRCQNVPYPPVGRIFKVTEKIRISSMAIQKLGMDKPRNENHRKKLLVNPVRRRAANTPANIPKPNDMNLAAPTSINVAGSLCHMISETGRP